MALIDKVKLSKLMMMTTSSNDGEALNALRLANQLIKAAGYDWSKLLGGHQATPPPRPPVRPSGRGTSEAAAKYDRPKSKFTDPDIPRMLKSLLRDTKGDFRNILDSFNDQFIEKGYLTERQYEVVLNAFEREK